jgi:hypothetical protein
MGFDIGYLLWVCITLVMVGVTALGSFRNGYRFGHKHGFIYGRYEFSRSVMLHMVANKKFESVDDYLKFITDLKNVEITNDYIINNKKDLLCFFTYDPVYPSKGSKGK